MKICTRCNKENISSFAQCEDCRIKARALDKKRNSTEKRKNWKKQFRSSDSEKEKMAIRSKRRYESKKEYILSKNKEYHKQNDNKIKEYMREWRRNNKEKCATYHANRKAALLNCLNDLTSEQVENLFVTHDYCEYCGTKENLTLDHIIPISRGGPNTLLNVTIACKPCNSSKCDKLLSEWRR